MRKTIIGCCFATIGALFDIVILVLLGDIAKTLHTWSTPPGKFGTALETASLKYPLIFSTGLLVIGLVILIIEYFREQK